MCMCVCMHVCMLVLKCVCMHNDVPADNSGISCTGGGQCGTDCDTPETQSVQ